MTSYNWALYFRLHRELCATVRFLCEKRNSVGNGNFGKKRRKAKIDSEGKFSVFFIVCRLLSALPFRLCSLLLRLRYIPAIKNLLSALAEERGGKNLITLLLNWWLFTFHESNKLLRDGNGKSLFHWTELECEKRRKKRKGNRSKRKDLVQKFPFLVAQTCTNKKKILSAFKYLIKKLLKQTFLITTYLNFHEQTAKIFSKYLKNFLSRNPF